MSWLDTIIGKFDARLLLVFPKKDLEQRYQEFNKEDSSDTYTRAVYEASDSVDTKAAAVLQHVSIMIAVAGLLFSQANGFFKWLFAIEMLIYVLLALLCLRLFMTQHHDPRFNDGQNVTTKEAILELTAKLTFMISIVLVASVVVELVVQ